ncbi:MAG: cell division ATP-binding protein FtsE [Clostridiales bacterium]|nr:cell division ATP-binding protein FtsE [Clostridiales bacterium]
MIVFDDVHKTYTSHDKTNVDALRGISFEIEDGEFVFIIGKSGSGKSTLMKCITCEETPNEGAVYIDDFNISDMSRALVPVLRRQIGMIYQDFRLIESKTVFENIAFAGELVGIPKKSLSQTVQLVLNVVGLKDKADAYPKELSGGEQQRVAIARAMVNNPTIVVADEPTGNLDPETSESIMALLQEINRGGATVVVCTHDSNLVDRMKKRVIEIEDGLIIRDKNESGYSEPVKKEDPEFEGYGIENAGVAFGDDPAFTNDADYNDSYDDEGFMSKPAAPDIFFGETPPEVVEAARRAEEEAKAAREAARIAEMEAALKAEEEMRAAIEAERLAKEEAERLAREEEERLAREAEEKAAREEERRRLQEALRIASEEEENAKRAAEEASRKAAEAAAALASASEEDPDDDAPVVETRLDRIAKDESETDTETETSSEAEEPSSEEAEEEIKEEEVPEIREIKWTDIDLDIQEDDD